MITILFFLIVPFASPLSFNFNSFSSSDPNITYERAYASNNVIHLTANLASMGRATYAEPLHLWDKPSGNLTDFTTHFSFVINSRNSSAYGDGIAFFLAPVGSRIPENATKGGGLGLTSDFEQLNSTDNPFVAVEFDIYQNIWDPPGEHVGIDVSSMSSVANVTWLSSIRDGKLNHARISYNSSTTTLTVVFTGFSGNTTIWRNLSHRVDLRNHLPEWVNFGFSAATGNASAIHSVNSWNFTSSLQINEEVTNPTTGTPPSPTVNPRPSKGKTGLIVGLVIGGLSIIGVLALLSFVFWKKRQGSKSEGDFAFDIAMADELERGTGPRKFSYAQLAKATNKFAQQEKLGEGGFGGVYKGFLREIDSYVAVKRVSSGSKQGIKEYSSEVRIISRLRHRNLVQLIGWCHEKKTLLLVYEFMPNGSLDTHLFKGRSPLSWAARYRIAQGLASALLYLHEEWEQCVVHRDIKSSNIMLDSNFNAKLGDFGLARLVDHEKGSQTTVLAGTMGYMAPECVVTGKASKETDVYSFGIVALEIACGRKPINPKANENQVNMVDWVWSLYGIGKLLEAADPKLAADFEEKELEQLMIVGLWCAHPDSNLRPTIRQAIQVLNFEAPLPILPPSMPVPTYFSPSVKAPDPNLLSLPPYQTIGTTSSQEQSLSCSYNTDSSKFTAASAASSPSASLLYSR